MSTVICTNGLLNQSLAVARSLGSRGIRVITSDKISVHASRFSKFAAKNVTYPDPDLSPGNFIDWLIATVRKEKIDVIMPTDDDTMRAVVAYQHELEPFVKFMVPSLESYRIAADKGKTVRLALDRDVPCPRTVQLPERSAYQEDELLEAVNPLEYPLVIKPRVSSGSRGVRFIAGENELVKTFQSVHRDYTNPIIQERVPQGEKYDVCLCYGSDHRLTASYVQKQIRNFPIERGPSTVQESVQFPELVQLSTRLMKGIPWRGLVAIEYMIDPRDGKPKLMEINPRYWSAAHLSILCGVDFPWMLYRLAIGQTVEPIHEYIAGKRGRILFPGDILHYLSNPDRNRMNPSFWTTKLHDDLVCLNDPWPLAGFFMSALRYSLSAKAWKFLIKR